MSSLPQKHGFVSRIGPSLKNRTFKLRRRTRRRERKRRLSSSKSEEDEEGSSETEEDEDDKEVAGQRVKGK